MVSEMTGSYNELLNIANDLNALRKRSRQEDISGSCTRLQNASLEIGKLWSGSCLGYHARVYRTNFQLPSRRSQSHTRHFDPYRGLASSSSYGHKPWTEYDFEKVQEVILERSGEIDLDVLASFKGDASAAFKESKYALLSIIAIELRENQSPFLDKMRFDTEKVSIKTIGDLADESLELIKLPRSQDKRALYEGKRLPPHWSFVNYSASIYSLLDSIPQLLELTNQTAKHIARQHRHSRQQATGTKVFIGHGRSPLWRELKDFIEGRLHLPTDEFNRVPVAGVSNKERLSEMLDEASIAFLIMTGEDEQPDGKNRARENVVHEVGLFQGRLGFQRAIVLLEEGCEEFSNITGLGQIRFPKGNISAKFEDIRRVVEREVSSQKNLVISQ